MTPYTYLIGWPELNTWYYGVRFAKKCNPSDLWNPYKTSSRHVKQFTAIHGDPPVKLVRKTFSDAISARVWESKVLKRLKVVQDIRWLNKTDNQSIAPLCGPAHPQFGKTGSNSHSYGTKRPKVAEIKRQEWTQNNPMKDPNIVAKKVASAKQNQHHMRRPEIVSKISGKNNWIYRNAETLVKRKQQFVQMNQARKGTHYRRLCCSHCGQDYASVQIKQHEQRCIQKFSV